jgi:NDP-sugar pyrophosphorylase family protein
MSGAGERGAAGVRAVILAGGRGTRLRPFTASFPKPLVPLGDTPVVEVLIRRLVEFGITDVTLTLGHLAELIQAYFLQRKELTSKLNLKFVTETAPTGTAGSLALIEGLTETFLVMNGDLLTDIDFHALLNFHRSQQAALTIAAHRRHVKVDLGVLEVGPDSRIVDYHEKPETTYDVSMGIYVYEPEVLHWITPGEYLDLPSLVLRLIRDAQKVCAFPAKCQWLDIGRPDDYARAQELFGAGRSQFESV